MSEFDALKIRFFDKVSIEFAKSVGACRGIEGRCACECKSPDKEIDKVVYDFFAFVGRQMADYNFSCDKLFDEYGIE